MSEYLRREGAPLFVSHRMHIVKNAMAAGSCTGGPAICGSEKET